MAKMFDCKQVVELNEESKSSLKFEFQIEDQNVWFGGKKVAPARSGCMASVRVN